MIHGRRAVRVAAPAKVNLGLEILGKRRDGYHEIKTIIATINLFDTLTFTLEHVKVQDQSTIDGMTLDLSQNLIRKAIELFQHEAGESVAVHVSIEKRIPMAAGLGGASADAAATLLALNTLRNAPLDDARIRELAGRLGSDVPFFLGGPTSMASGRGVNLASLPSPRGWVVLMTPLLDLRGKTGALYAALLPTDFRDGTSIDQQANRMLLGGDLDTRLLGNAFLSAWERLGFPLEKHVLAMRASGAPFVALSGAGPTLYTIVGNELEAQGIALNIEEHAPAGTGVILTEFRNRGLSVSVA